MTDDSHHRKQWSPLPSWFGLQGRLTASSGFWGMVVLLGLFAVEIAVGGIVLNNAQRAAEQEAKANLAMSAGELAVTLAQMSDTFRRIAGSVRDLVGQPSQTPGTRAYLETRLRSTTDDKRNSVASIAYIGPTRSSDWNLHLERAPLDHAAREELRGTPPAAGQEGYGLPVLAAGQDSWAFPYSVVVPASRGAGVIVLMVDGQAIAEQLHGIVVKPVWRIGVWRGDGAFLTGTDHADARSAVALRRISPLRPGPSGRSQENLPDPLGHGERFVALQQIAGHDLYVTVSSDAAVEMAAYQRFRLAVFLLLTAVLIITALAGRALLARRANRQAATAGELARAQQAMLATILDGVNAGVYRMLIGPGLRFNRYYFNLGTARLLRRTVEDIEATGRAMIYAEPAPSREAQLGIIRDLLETGTAQYEVQLRCGDGQLRWMRFQLRVITRDGDELDCVGLMTDIEVEKAAAIAAVSGARLAMLGELSTVIAHEIKQPLAMIGLVSGTVQAMLESKREVSRADMAAKLQRIIGLTHRAAALSDNLRRFARRDDTPLAAIDLGKSVDEALLLCGAAMRDSQIKLDISLPEHPPAVLGAPEMFEHVITNLLMNSRHAMSGMPASARRIEVVATVEATTVVLRVRDTGPGIPAEVLPRLFEPFFTTKPVGEGTGLGLSICANILASAGGEILAGNAAGGGAEFTVLLRRADCAGSTIDA